MSYHMLNGLGAAEECVTLPFTYKNGVESTGAVCPTAGCGDVYALQQALNDLGASPVPLVIDGAAGTNTFNAIAYLAVLYGKPYSGSGLDAAVCKMVGDAWYAKYKGEPYPPKSTITAIAQRATDPVATRISSMDKLRRLAVATKAGEAGSGGGVVDQAKNWWAGLGTTGKVGVVAGGVAVLGVLVYALTKPGRQVEMQVMKANCSSCMTPNGKAQGWLPPSRRRPSIANDRIILRSFDSAMKHRKSGDIVQYSMLRSGLKKMVARHKGKGGSHAQIVKRANKAIKRVTRAMALTYKMNKKLFSFTI